MLSFGHMLVCIGLGTCWSAAPPLLPHTHPTAPLPPYPALGDSVLSVSDSESAPPPTTTLLAELEGGAPAEAVQVPQLPEACWMIILGQLAVREVSGPAGSACEGQLE